MKGLKRALAVLALVIIAALYLITIYCAIFVKQVGKEMFFLSIAATLTIPLILYLVFWLFRLFRSESKQGEAKLEAKKRRGFREAAMLNGGGKKRTGTGTDQDREDDEDDWDDDMDDFDEFDGDEDY